MSQKAYEAYRVAILVDHFHLTIPEILELTELQISTVYFHRRDKNGAIAYRFADDDDQDRKKLNEAKARAADLVAAQYDLTPEEVEALRAQMEEETDDE